MTKEGKLNNMTAAAIIAEAAQSAFGTSMSGIVDIFHNHKSFRHVNFLLFLN